MANADDLKTLERLDALYDENFEKEYARQDFVIGCTESIMHIMESAEISKADLADVLGKSRAYVTQVLNGSRNMTLNTLADIAGALGAEVSIKFEAAEEKSQSPLNKG